MPNTICGYYPKARHGFKLSKWSFFFWYVNKLIHVNICVVILCDPSATCESACESCEPYNIKQINQTLTLTTFLVEGLYVNKLKIFIVQNQIGFQLVNKQK